MSEVNSITAVHQRELSGYEKKIERGIATFVEVGSALKAIRDKKLYKLTHKSFESYVQERWGWTRVRAYQLIETADVQKNVNNCIQNEGQAREVAKAPEDKQAEVVEQAVRMAEEEGRKPIAKDFAKAREIVCEQPAVEEVEYEDFQSDIVEQEYETVDASYSDITEQPDDSEEICKAFAAASDRLNVLFHIFKTLKPHEKKVLAEWIAKDE